MNFATSCKARPLSEYKIHTVEQCLRFAQECLMAKLSEKFLPFFHLLRSILVQINQNLFSAGNSQVGDTQELVLHYK